MAMASAQSVGGMGWARVAVRGMVVGAVALMAAAMACCGPSLGQYDVRVTLDDQLRLSPRSITVDMIALSPTEAANLKDKSLMQYFFGNDADRAGWLEGSTAGSSAGSSGGASGGGELFTEGFGVGDTQDIVLSRRDPRWAGAWKGRETLFILANLPAAVNDDRARLELPRSTAFWEAGNNSEIVVRVRSDRLELVTPMLTPEP